MSYAGTLSYSWAADISISSENATLMQRELQNGDPTEHLDMRRCGHRFPIPWGIRRNPLTSTDTFWPCKLQTWYTARSEAILLSLCGWWD